MIGHLNNRFMLEKQFAMLDESYCLLHVCGIVNIDNICVILQRTHTIAIIRDVASY